MIGPADKHCLEQRILEPELMDGDEQVRAYAEANFEQPHSAFIQLFKQTFLEERIQGCILDLGCGPGDITFRFARAFPDCCVHGIDGSPSMLSYGNEILSSAADIRDRVELVYGRLPEVNPPRPDYRTIITNSLLHHLENPQTLWNSVKKYSSSGTKVFVMDLRRPANTHIARELTETYAADEPLTLQHDFYHSLLAAFRVDEVKQQLAEADLDYLSVRESSDRHLLVSGLIT